MSISVHCMCGQSFEVPDSFAGKSGKCKWCGARLLVPDQTEGADRQPVPTDEMAQTIAANDLPARGDADDAEPVASTTLDIPQPAVQAGGSRASMPGEIPQKFKNAAGSISWVEPWYYPCLSFTAMTGIWVGVVGSAMILVSGLIRASDEKPSQQAVIVFVAFIWGLATLVGSLIAGCSVLVGLDAARHVRATRIIAGSTMRGHGFTLTT